MQRTARQQLSPLQMLMQMGFPQKRAEKALAATGDRSVQLASDWLAAHLNDPFLDDDSPREFVVYIRPSGPLTYQIYNFWSEVLESVGRNAAQNLMPHVTLCSYFKADNMHSWKIGDMLLSAVNSVLGSANNTKSLLPLPLEKYTSQNYMGLFVKSPAAHVLQNIKRHFVQSAISVSPDLSSAMSEEDLHLTLAYSFSSSQFNMLEELVRQVVVTSPATWEICLYSRETRFNKCDLYKASLSHEPQHEDELQLMRGDYVYVNPDEMPASEGWVCGTSWLTGCRGLVPRSALVLAPASDAWTLHRGVTMTAEGRGYEVTDGAGVTEDSLYQDLVSCDGCSSVNRATATPGLSLSLLNLIDHSEGTRRSTTAHSDASSTLHSREASLVDGASDQRQIEDLYAKVQKSSARRRSSSFYDFPIKGPRTLFVARHGERADFAFGDWCKVCFDVNGRYKRADLNLQATLPSRSGAPQCFRKDSPLTKVGELQAQLVGEGFAAANVSIHHVFCSPSLRCVMTATNILRSLSIADKVPLKIEPGLFEWFGWYADGMPHFMSHEELAAAGYNIDFTYTPVWAINQLGAEESCEQYYLRSGQLTSALLASTAHLGGNILLVAHASSLDACTRQLVGGTLRNMSEMRNILKKVPYCAVITAEQSAEDSSIWALKEPPCRSPMHSANHAFDWTAFRM